MNINSGNNHNRELVATVRGRYEHTKAAIEAQEALLSRPHFSLRLQVYLAFFLAFLLATGIATALVMGIYQVESKIAFLEIVNDYGLQVEEARRYEKNYFLYGTGLDAALQAIFRASETLDRNSTELSVILGKKRLSSILENITRYEDTLEKLSQFEREGKRSDSKWKKSELEPELRKQGHRMVSLAHELLAVEKKSMSTVIARTRNIHILSLILLLVSMVCIAYILGSRLLENITRFESYARRIASGDFTPITPTRRYRDEFTDLALSINEMLLELESHESALIQSHKIRAIGTLTAGIAHELNNPLNNITLTTHVLLEDYSTLDDEERQEMIGDTINEVDRAKGIVSNLLEFARESSSQMEPLDLLRVVKSTVSLASNEIKLSGIQIDVRATENLPRIHGDRQQLKQVFLNLILNAISASSKGGKIQILVLPADEPNEIAVKIIDFGTGIPPNILDRIFDPFFTTKDTGKGTGLGLSVSQGIIAKHRGRIRVDSRPNKGSTFTVILPITTLSSDL